MLLIGSIVVVNEWEAGSVRAQSKRRYGFRSRTERGVGEGLSGTTVEYSR